MRATILTVFLVLGTVVWAQTSADSPKLKAVLAKHPEADANKDGVLTVSEARAHVRKNPELRKQWASKRAANRGGNKTGPKAAGAPEGGKRLVYKRVGDVELPLYVYKPAGHKADAKAPAIVFFFGGGWTGGSPTQFEHHCKYLAERGMVAITVEYRVKSRHGVRVEDCIEDAKSAMRWVRGNAATLGVDPDRIASSGGSAGGHLAACVAVIDAFDAKTDDVTVSPKPNAMVLFNPAMGWPEEAATEEALARISQRTHGPPMKCFPLTYASNKQPPCIMFFGTEDKLLAGAKAHRDASTKAGNSCGIIEYEGQGHSFFNYGKSNGKYYELTVAEMDKFLVELGWLPKQ